MGPYRTPETSPCCGCPRKDYAAGCATGCNDRESYILRCKERKKKSADAKGIDGLLAKGAAKNLKSAGKHVKSV